MSYKNLFIQRNKSVDDRFWEKVDKSSDNDGCWMWKGYKNKDGYGSFVVTLSQSNYKRYMAHRFAYMLTHNVFDIPRDVFVCHSCDNPSCCNPNHLWLGSNKENQDDYFAKGLPNNHPVGEDNPRSKLKESDVHEIRRLGSLGWSTYKIAKKFGVSNSSVFYILKRIHWKHV